MCKEVDGEHVEITPGVYLLQILLYDNSEGHGRITIPPVEFEILEPIFPDDESIETLSLKVDE